jgi:predicted phage tail protein
MTVIKFYGSLAKKFGSEIKLHIGNLKFLFSAIDSVKPGFINFMKEKEKNCQFYLMSKILKENVIEIFPSIAGAGIIAAFYAIIGFGGALLQSKIMMAFGLIYFTGLYKSPTFWKIVGYTLQVIGAILAFTPFAPLGFLLSILGGIAVGYGNYLEAMQNLEKMNKNQPKMSGGGDASIVTANGKSYVFNRTINLATQGSIVPIVYGKLKIGSKLIAVNIKTTDSSLAFEGEAFNLNQFVEIYG